MGLVARGIDLDAGQGQVSRKFAFRFQGFEGGNNSALDVREHVHDCLSFAFRNSDLKEVGIFESGACAGACPALGQQGLAVGGCAMLFC